MSSNLMEEDFTLVVDSATSELFVGLCKNRSWLFKISKQASAVECFQQTVDLCMQESGVSIKDISCFIYDRGPGSILGIRTVIAALQSWKILNEKSVSIYSFQSLELIARNLIKNGKSNFAILSDWKKDHWNVMKCKNSIISSISPLQLEDLRELEATGTPLFYLPQRKIWQILDIGVNPVILSPETVIDFVHIDAFLRKEENSLKVYLPENPEYKKWDQKRHY